MDFGLAQRLGHEPAHPLAKRVTAALERPCADESLVQQILLVGIRGGGADAGAGGVELKLAGVDVAGVRERDVRRRGVAGLVGGGGEERVTRVGVVGSRSTLDRCSRGRQAGRTSVDRVAEHDGARGEGRAVGRGGVEGREGARANQRGERADDENPDQESLDLSHLSRFLLEPFVLTPEASGPFPKKSE